MKKIFKIGYMLSFLLLPFNVEARSHVFILTKPEAVGDYNQLLGIKNSLQPIAPEATSFLEFRVTDLDPMIKTIRNLPESGTQEKIIILSVGDYGIDAFKKIKAEINNPHIRYVLSSHQLTDKIFLERDNIDLIALPAHAISKDFEKEFKKENVSKIIPTIGVAHNLNKQQIEAAYEENKDKILPLKACKKYIGVILGGDAPDSSNKMHYYTAEEAVRLADHVAGLAKRENAVILATDGPRTGKHNPTNGQVNEKVHTEQGELDAVSGAFQLKLSQHLPPDQFKFYGFIHGKPSLSKAIFGAVVKTQGKIFIPSESTSMISEGIDSMGKDMMVVYPTNSMNDTHKAHVKLEQQHGRITLLDDKFQENSLSTQPSPINESAAQVIAHAILPLLQ
ncbi:MAG: mitochondrial fission ELM1 family protein [Candidatus Paracaedibacteraceae bacterium]|nr:mitochondrial fission ELM1 family protein [Candidatus Paracaedibacteraceae bacterium]